MPFTAAPDGALVQVVALDLFSEALHSDVTDPVVLIHGLGCDWRHWSRQIGWIAHGRRAALPDVRGGAGKTRWPSPAERLRGFASLMGEAIAGATIIEGQGHFPDLEAPEPFNPIPAAAPDIDGAR